MTAENSCRVEVAKVGLPAPDYGTAVAAAAAHPSLKHAASGRIKIERMATNAAGKKPAGQLEKFP